MKVGKWYDSFKLGGETRDIKLRNMIHKHGTNIGQGSRADNYGQLILIHSNKRILGHQIYVGKRSVMGNQF